jgi:hypothetical protein
VGALGQIWVLAQMCWRTHTLHEHRSERWTLAPRNTFAGTLRLRVGTRLCAAAAARGEDPRALFSGTRSKFAVSPLPEIGPEMAIRIAETRISPWNLFALCINLIGVSTLSLLEPFAACFGAGGPFAPCGVAASYIDSYSCGVQRCPVHVHLWGRIW